MTSSKKSTTKDKRIEQQQWVVRRKGWVGSMEFWSWKFIEKNKLILKKGEAAVWRREVWDGFGSLEFQSWRFLEREKKSDTKEEGGGGCLEKRNLRWVWVFRVSVMEVSRERKKNLILKKKGEAAVWREIWDGFYWVVVVRFFPSQRESREQLRWEREEVAERESSWDERESSCEMRTKSNVRLLRVLIRHVS